MVHINDPVAWAAELSGHPSCLSDRRDFYSPAFFHQLCKTYCSDCIWVFAAEAIYTMYCYAGLLLSKNRVQFATTSIYGVREFKPLITCRSVGYQVKSNAVLHPNMQVERRGSMIQLTNELELPTWSGCMDSVLSSYSGIRLRKEFYLQPAPLTTTSLILFSNLFLM